MQTFSSDRKRVLRILLTLHQVPVKKKRETGWPRKKTKTPSTVTECNMQNRYNRQTKNWPKVQKNKNLPVISADFSDFLIFGV
mgnify:CR=1 FL=1